MKLVLFDKVMEPVTLTPKTHCLALPLALLGTLVTGMSVTLLLYNRSSYLNVMDFASLIIIFLSAFFCCLVAISAFAVYIFKTAYSCVESCSALVSSSSVNTPVISIDVFTPSFYAAFFVCCASA